MTEKQAYALLPKDAKWSSSFGNPGEGGFIEYHRTSAGQWIISNGPYFLSSSEFMWNCVKAD